MTKQHDINLHEDAIIKFSMKGLWALISAVFISGGAIVGYQMRMDSKIQELYLNNQSQHVQIMLKLTEMDNRQQMFVLKQQLEELQIFITRRRDMISNNTNIMSSSEELVLRQQIRDFLK